MSTTTANRESIVPRGRPTRSRNVKIAKALLPMLPLIMRVSFAHLLHLSATSAYVDLRSDLIIAVLRSFLEPDPSRPVSLSAVQRASARDPGVRGRLWVSTYVSLPPPEQDALQALLRVIDTTSPQSNAGGSKPERMYPLPSYAPVSAEWTGYRAQAQPKEPAPTLAERPKYEEMMKECRSPVTILYVHGGAFYLLDPVTHRPTTKKLAKITGGRCYSVRYRLAPRFPFPAALLDVFVSYLTLLYPPPDAFHAPVQPEHIAFAGDSAGGNLVLTLLQLLLELRRRDEGVLWHGKVRELPLPAAVTCNSPWVDLSHSFESWHGDDPAVFDYLPKPNTQARSFAVPCDLWPAGPRRRHPYVTGDELVTYPMVSPVMACSWTGAPPIYICTGWELLADEDKFMAKKLAADGVTVVFEEYEGMPHCFALMLTTLPGAHHCLDNWAGFIRKAVEEREGGSSTSTISSSAMTIHPKTLEERSLPLDRLCDFTHEQVRERVFHSARQSRDVLIPAKL